MTNCHFLHDNVVNSFLIAPSSSSYFHLTFSPTYLTWHFYNVMYGYLWYVNCDSRLYKRNILKLKNRFCSRMLCWLIVVHYTSDCSNCTHFIYLCIVSSWTSTVMQTTVSFMFNFCAVITVIPSSSNPFHITKKISGFAIRVFLLRILIKACYCYLFWARLIHSVPHPLLRAILILTKLCLILSNDFCSGCQWKAGVRFLFVCVCVRAQAC